MCPWWQKSYLCWFLLLLHISLFMFNGNLCPHATRTQSVEWSMILLYTALAAEVCCVIPDLLNCLSVQCWWVMVLPYLSLVSDLKSFVLQLCFSVRDRPTISPWDASWDFAVDQVFSGAGRPNLHSIGKARCKNWNILGEYRKSLDSASLWTVKSMIILASGDLIFPDTSSQAMHFIRAVWLLTTFPSFICTAANLLCVVGESSGHPVHLYYF